jgi:hypothetical protein
MDDGIAGTISLLAYATCCDSASRRRNPQSRLVLCGCALMKLMNENK